MNHHCGNKGSQQFLPACAWPANELYQRQTQYPGNSKMEKIRSEKTSPWSEALAQVITNVFLYSEAEADKSSNDQCFDFRPSL